MNRILFLSPVAVLGGAERVLLAAITGIRRESPATKLRVIVPGDGPLLEAVHTSGAEVEVVPMPSALTRLGDSQLRQATGWVGRVSSIGALAASAPAAAEFTARLRRSVVRFQPSLVHSNGVKTHLFSRLAVPRGIPVAWHLHDFLGARPMAGRLLRRASGRVEIGIAVSNAVAADARQVLPNLQVEVVYNGVDTERFCPGPAADLDALAGLPPAPAGTVRVGLVATYARWKGHLVFLEAARSLAASSPHATVRWYIIGGPIYRTAAQFSENELRHAVHERRLADRVGFVPFQPDPAAAYRALDVVVHASTLPEPFGLTVAEAMACGRTVVVSNAGGAAELFTDGEDAIGVAPGDAAGLLAVVRRLIHDSDLRVRLGRAARESTIRRFPDTEFALRLLRRFRPWLNGFA